uniref:Uncharacterized protein ycf23 n=1 Tax=Melanothamnus harveyi TaxID=397005 RepID=A0A1Z1MHW6_MELHR|nr:hypothetical protein [Melanothamnus harveyi]ARW65341.1 hypothetical protein [Melanothamnus harveyi]
MNIHHSKVKKSLQSKSAVKIISGINNTNISDVTKIVKAANLSKATYIDIAANPRLVYHTKSLSSLPVCISSINALDIYNCLIAGADIIEIGNYDFFYKNGIYLTLDQILSLVLEVKKFATNIDICVTIPYHISLCDQIHLAKQLEIIGVNLIQTEGIANLSKSKYINSNFDISNLNNTFLPSLLSTYIISKSIKLPIITASGCKNLTSSVASIYGASGIGIGSSLTKFKSTIDMVRYINQSCNSLVISDTLKDKFDKLINISELIK